MTGQNGVPCPSKGKRRFDTEEDANRSLDNIWRRAGKDGPGVLPSRAYLCQCGRWHLTSKAFDRRYPRRGEVLSHTPSPSTNPNC